MNKVIVTIIALIGIAIGLGWYVTAQESQSFQHASEVERRMLEKSECPPDQCP